MNVYLDLGNPGGSGFWVGGYMSQGREMGKLVYEQPGNEVDGSCHSKEGSKSKLRRVKQGSKRGNHQGEKIARGMIMYISILVSCI
jgi:hypothetical protein